MKLALWILVALVCIGVGLYAGELYRQDLQRKAVAQALAEAQVAAKKAALVADWQQRTEEQIDWEQRVIKAVCKPGLENVKPDPNIKDILHGTKGNDRYLCDLARTDLERCVNDSYNLKRGIIPKRLCDDHDRQ
jgi:hypothetical protein